MEFIKYFIMIISIFTFVPAFGVFIKKIRNGNAEVSDLIVMMYSGLVLIYSLFR